MIPVALVQYMLTDQIRENINHKLNTFSDYFDISQIEIGLVVDDLDVSEFKYSEIEQSKKIWEDLVKLSLHFFIDYEFYKNFFFANRYSDLEYRVRLRTLGFILENNQWKSIRKPNIKDVQTNVFLYFLYRSISAKIVLNTENDQNVANEQKLHEIIDQYVTVTPYITSTIKCRFCDSDNSKDDRECNICFGELFCDNYEIMVVRDDQEPNNDSMVVGISSERDEDSRHIDLESVHETAHDIKNTMNDQNNKYGGNNDNVIDLDYGTKWKCGRCQLLNEYSFDNCTECGTPYKYGRWTCGNCKWNNNCTMDECCRCGKRNDNVKSNNAAAGGVPNTVNYGDANTRGDRYEGPSNINQKSHHAQQRKRDNTGGKTRIPANEWKCGKCTVRQSFKHSICEMCDCSRDIQGVWQCAKCAAVNRCDKERCGGCEEWNDNFPVKLCKYCQKNRLNGTDGRCEECCRTNRTVWVCQFRRCGERNQISDQYCCKCGLWGYNSYNRGDEGRQWYFGSVRRIWICKKCDNINCVRNRQCSKWRCNETRYEKMQCTKCKKHNDGTSNICIKCREPLQ